MTMSLSFRHLPEVQAAQQTLKAAFADTLPSKYMWLGRVAVYLLAFAIGAAGAAAALYFGLMTTPGEDFWRTCIMVLAILSGFIITTMVFTGKIEAAKSLSYTELRTVAAKSTHLLLYQFGTLLNHLVCIAFVFFAPSVALAHELLASALTAIAFGLLLVSMWRSLLIPVQIIELHRFTHAALLREKKDEAEKVASTL